MIFNLSKTMDDIFYTLTVLYPSEIQLRVLLFSSIVPDIAIFIDTSVLILYVQVPFRFQSLETQYYFRLQKYSPKLIFTIPFHVATTSSSVKYFHFFLNIVLYKLLAKKKVKSSGTQLRHCRAYLRSKIHGVSLRLEGRSICLD